MIRLPERANPFTVGEKVMAVDLNDTLDALVSKERLYVDGIQAQQLTDNADTAFGQNDATGKKLKLAQSFIATRTTLTSVLLKKGTTSRSVVTTDSTVNTFSFASFATGGTSYTDNGQVSSKRQVSGSAGNHISDYYELSKVITGNIGDVVTGSVTVEKNFVNANTVVTFWVDGVQVGGGTSIPQNATTTVNFSYTATATSHTIKFRATSNINTGSGIVDRWASFTHTAVVPFNPNLRLDVYADNGGVPSNTSLGQATISGANWEAVSVGGIQTFTFTPITNMVLGSKYWVVLTSSTPDSNIFANVRKNTAGGYADGEIKYNNTTDGWTTDTGDFYFIINEDKRGKVVTTDPTTGFIPNSLIKLDGLYKYLAQKAGASIGIFSVASQNIFSETIPANTLRAGSTIKATMFLSWGSASFATQNWKVELKLGTKVIGVLNFSTTGNGANDTHNGYCTLNITVNMTTLTTQNIYVAQQYRNMLQYNNGTWAYTAPADSASVSTDTGSINMGADQVLSLDYTRIVNGNGGTVNVGATLIEYFV